MLRDLLLVAVVVGAAQGLGFEGCFLADDQSPSDQKETYVFEDFNTNMDCVQQCSNRGYILALTRNDTCICSLNFPGTQIGMPQYGNASGEHTPCDMSCAGSLVARHFSRKCQGDECCGGNYRGQLTYTVHATGGMNVIEQIHSRLNAVLMDESLTRRLVKAIQRTTKCYSNFTEVASVKGYIRMELKQSQYRTERNTYSVADCQKLCVRESRCLSITYFQGTMTCSLNYVRTQQVATRLTKTATYVFDRNCKLQLEVPDQHFSLELINYKRVFSASIPISTSPLDQYDFELDLTNSNFYDTIHRRVMMTNTNEAHYSTDSGFEENKSVMETSEESTADTHSDSREQSQTSSSSSSFSLGASATAGFKAFGFEASVTVTSNFGTESSKALTSGNSRTSTKETRKSHSKSVTKGSSMFFNNGYSKTNRDENMREYDFSMTVPPLHRGELRFTLQEEPITLKWRAHFMLNDYIKIKVVDYYVYLHVSKLLTYEQRSFYVMGTIKYDRSKVVGKTTIYDKEGNLVERNDQLLENAPYK